MIRVTAHAKINFFLEITGKRPDGYHTLSTVFQTISLGDELTFSAAEDLSLTCSDPESSIGLAQPRHESGASSPRSAA